MADLPSFRVNRHAPFTHTGLDFAGPFEIRSGTTRNAPKTKAYVCIFVCMSTKAKHLELAHNLSTKAFLAVYNRFVSRRGIPAHLYSDNGTNFVGASRELPKLLKAASKEADEIYKRVLNEGTQWHFNPPSAPSFGGIWERGVRSIKTHLNRVAAKASFTYEEFNTLLTMIEACLNSQPLCPLENDCEEIEALTPGHFLIGKMLRAVPMPSIADKYVSTNEKFQLIRKLTEHFWQRWYKEYLHTLQQRVKWKVECENIKIGQIVIIIEDNIPPANWLLAKITGIELGSDGKVRVVEVRTKSGTLKRPIHKICPLPIE